MSTQKRRSISVKGEVYDQVHAYCKKAGISMSAFIEERIAVFFSGMEETSFKEEPQEEESEVHVPQRKKSSEDAAVFTENVKPPMRKSSMSEDEIITEVRQHFTF